MILLIDNYDSFTFNLVHFLGDVGGRCEVVRNDKLTVADALGVVERSAGEKAGAKPLPYLFACAFIANAASFVLPISNPANLVVFGDHMPPLLAWLRAFALPALAAIVVTWGVLALLFRGEGLIAWVGLLVVVQNIFTSLFNSHIFDFHEGWMYVLGVGVAGGTLLKQGFRGAVQADFVG